MKQSITEEQLNKLLNEQKNLLIQEGSKDLHCFTIGEMIAILQNKWPYFKILRVESDGNFFVVVSTNPSGSRLQFVKLELCDALWEAVIYSETDDEY